MNDAGTLLVLDKILSLSILHTFLPVGHPASTQGRHEFFFATRRVLLALVNQFKPCAVNCESCVWQWFYIKPLFQIFPTGPPKKYPYILHCKGRQQPRGIFFPNGWSSQASLLPSGLDETQGTHGWVCDVVVFFSSMDGKPWRTQSSYIYIYICSMVNNLSEYEGQCRVLSFGQMTKAKSPLGCGWSPIASLRKKRVKIGKCWVLLKIPLKWWVKIVNIQTLFNMIYSISQFQSYIVMQTHAIVPTDEFWIAARDLHSGPQRFSGGLWWRSAILPHAGVMTQWCRPIRMFFFVFRIWLMRWYLIWGLLILSNCRVDTNHSESATVNCDEFSNAKWSNFLISISRHKQFIGIQIKQNGFLWCYDV